MDIRKAIWMIFLLASTPVLMGQYYSSGSKKAIKRFEEARDCLAQRDPSCAEEALLKAIRADRDFMEAYQLLARATPLRRSSDRRDVVRGEGQRN